MQKGSSRRPSRSRRFTPDEAEAKAERLRNELIDKVRHGKLTPAKAEAEAVRLGLSPLARCLDADQFNPMGELQWSLPMVVAWIVWRTPHGVRENWDAYRQECLDWQGG